MRNEKLGCSMIGIVGSVAVLALLGASSASAQTWTELRTDEKTGSTARVLSTNVERFAFPYNKPVRARLEVNGNYSSLLISAPGAPPIMEVSPRVFLDGLDATDSGIAVGSADGTLSVARFGVAGGLAALGTAREIRIRVVFFQNGSHEFVFAPGAQLASTELGARILAEHEAASEAGRAKARGFLEKIEAEKKAREATYAAERAAERSALEAERREVFVQTLERACAPGLEWSVAKPLFTEAWEKVDRTYYRSSRGLPGMLLERMSEDAIREVVAPRAACVLAAVKKDKHSYAHNLAPYADGVR